MRSIILLVTAVMLLSAVSAIQINEKFVFENMPCYLQAYSEEIINECDTSSSGTAYIKMNKLTSDTDMLNIRIKVSLSDFSSSEERIYAYLVDNNTGFYQNIGELKMSKNGHGVLNFMAKEFNMNPYNVLVITKENIVDIDSEPGMPVLMVDISSIHKPLKMKANLRGVYQNPKVITGASGYGVFYIDTEHNKINYNLDYMKLKGEETASHIHGFADKKNNAPVLFELPLGEHKEGFLMYDESQEASILSGKTYVNVHSTAFPNGEIRGQIVLA